MSHRENEFDRIVRDHAPWVLRFVERRSQPGLDAEGLAQDVFVVAFGKRGRLREPERVRPFLVGIAKKVLANAGRKRARRRRLLRRAPIETLRERTAPGLDDLESAVRELPEELAEVIDVYYSRDLTYEKAAALLGVPRATVQSRLRRAIRLLRERLGAGEEERK